MALIFVLIILASILAALLEQHFYRSRTARDHADFVESIHRD
jgi:hypothetical protein